MSFEYSGPSKAGSSTKGRLGWMHADHELKRVGAGGFNDVWVGALELAYASDPERGLAIRFGDLDCRSKTLRLRGVLDT